LLIIGWAGFGFVKNIDSGYCRTQPVAISRYGAELEAGDTDFSLNICCQSVRHHVDERTVIDGDLTYFGHLFSGMNLPAKSPRLDLVSDRHGYGGLMIRWRESY